jgi:RNAse (barnase) inhibitor barstar
MKIKIWVLSGTNADEASPRLPGLYLTREAADEAFDELMREAWEDLGDGEEEYPGATEVQYRLRQLNGREQDLWDITAHEIDVPLQQVFRNLWDALKELHKTEPCAGNLPVFHRAMSAIEAVEGRCVPEPFRDLLAIAKPLVEGCGDYRVDAVVLACEAFLEAHNDG